MKYYAQYSAGGAWYDIDEKLYGSIAEAKVVTVPFKVKRYKVRVIDVNTGKKVS